MDSDFVFDQSVAELERVQEKLTWRIEKLGGLRDRIKETLATLKMDEQPPLLVEINPAFGASPNGARSTEIDDTDMSNTELVSHFLERLPPQEFTAVSAYKAFAKRHPGRLEKRQFQTAFRKLVIRERCPLTLVRERPGNIPSVFRWLPESVKGDELVTY